MRKLIGLLALLSALGALGAATTGAFAAETPPPGGEATSAESTASEPAPDSTASPDAALCSPNKICTYGLTGFREEVISFECAWSGAFGTGGNLLSALNKCGNKTAWLRENGNSVRCMNPGAEAPTPPAFNEVFIAAEYGAFC